MSERIYSKSIANAIKNFLTEDDWKYVFDERAGLFKFALSMKGKIKQVNFFVAVKDDEYIVYALSLLGADVDDKKMMTEMAEFVCRVNYGVKNGNFEFDMDDGEIRFKSFVDCDGIIPTMEIIKNSLQCPAVMFDRYAAGIVDIVFRNSSAKEAFKKCRESIRKEFNAFLDKKVDEDISNKDVD